MAQQPFLLADEVGLLLAVCHIILSPPRSADGGSDPGKFASFAEMTPAPIGDRYTMVFRGIPICLTAYEGRGKIRSGAGRMRTKYRMKQENGEVGQTYSGNRYQ